MSEVGPEDEAELEAEGRGEPTGEPEVDDDDDLVEAIDVDYELPERPPPLSADLETAELPRLVGFEMVATFEEAEIEALEGDPWTEKTPDLDPEQDGSVLIRRRVPRAEPASPIEPPLRAAGLRAFGRGSAGLGNSAGRAPASSFAGRDPPGRDFPGRDPSGRDFPGRDFLGRDLGSGGETVASIAAARRPLAEGRNLDPARAWGLMPRARRYPQMRALLSDPASVPPGLGGPRARVRPHERRPLDRFAPEPSPVRRDPDWGRPEALRERSAPPRPETPAPAPDVDQMLAAMADGLLVGDDGSGGTEVRVTLSDEFFAGTELRICLGVQGVTAVFVPPDRATYATLRGNVDDLRMRLEARGLRVTEVRVAEP